LTALARLLGRQAAREALRLEGKVASFPTVFRRAKLTP
jgi:hypothetical protein